MTDDLIIKGQEMVRERVQQAIKRKRGRQQAVRMGAEIVVKPPVPVSEPPLKHRRSEKELLEAARKLESKRGSK